MTRNTASAWTWTLLWAVLVFASVALRPLLPVDETRYATVAWEMWLNGNYLVPHLNGETYSHKPPLLFWLMNASWAVFGVNDWSHRFVAPLFGLASLFLTARIGRKLWPETQAGNVAPLLLLAGVFWATFSTLSMFDMLVATWTLVGIHGLIVAWRGNALAGWAQFAVAIGFGVLSKGPVILVFLLPSALAAPYWVADTHRPRWGIWYAGVLAATLAGAAIALAWAIPAGISGGAAYRDAIFWGQSAGRVVDSFAHREPFYWYLAILPPMLLPWLLWPSFLRALWRTIRPLRDHQRKADPGLRLAAVWAGLPFLILSVFSGKAPHYLLPVLPAIALAAARLVERRPDGARAVAQARPIAVLGVLIVLTVHLAAQAPLRERYDLKPIALAIGAAERDGAVIGHYGNYHGQFNFLGRLKHPVVETGDAEVIAWLRRTPKAKVIAYRDSLPSSAKPDFVQNFRSRLVMLWDRDAVLANPSIAQRGVGD